MNVFRRMGPALVLRRAVILILQCVHVNVITVDMVQMSVVEIIDVAVVLDCGVAATRAVSVCMPFLLHASLRHGVSLFRSRGLGSNLME
jgi:hypothetical protein